MKIKGEQMITVDKVRRLLKDLPYGMEIRFEVPRDVDNQTKQKIVVYGKLFDEDGEFFSITLENV